MRIMTWVALLVFTTFAIDAQAVTFIADATIAAGDLTYEGQDIVIDGCVLTINGPHSFNSFQIINSGTLTHSPATTGQTDFKIDLTIAQDVVVDAGGSINVDGKGYGTNEGPGAGTNAGSGAFASGGGYGGAGGETQNDAPGGVPYGSMLYRRA